MVACAAAGDKEATVENTKAAGIGPIVDTQWAGCDPAQMGWAGLRIDADPPSAQRAGVSVTLTPIEINEAFARRSLTAKRLEDEKFCKKDELISTVHSARST